MHNEQIHEAWWSYLKEMFEFSFGEEVPILFESPHCGTCAHWFLINEDGLNHLAITSYPKEYDEIIKELSGNRVYAHREKGIVEDTYRDYRFYGWCKRYPPFQRSGYSIISFRSLFTLLSIFLTLAMSSRTPKGFTI